MNNFAIVTDTGCDLTEKALKEKNVELANLLVFDDKENNINLPTKEFYNEMRNGKVFKTSAANVGAFSEKFEQLLLQGKDVLCIAFSSGLSTTCNAAKIAAGELNEKYANKVIVIDTLCASGGEALALELACQKRDNGEDILEVEKYLKETLPKLCHWFVVDDLVYLKRGGRISPSTALLGTMLNIKPVLHVDDGGYLVSVEKVRGKKKAIKRLAEKYDELALDADEGTYFISHADAYEEALELERIISECHNGNKCSLIVEISPVIGSHCGPGTIALFFLGKNR